MYLFITVLILITCLLLAGVVLVQNSKGGGLAANFASQNQTMGVRKTADFLEKATWTLAIVLIVLSLAATLAIPKKHETEVKTELTTEGVTIPNATAPVQQAPATPVEGDVK